MPRSLVPEGRRALGRLALVDNYGEAVNRLRQALARVTNETSRATTKKHVGFDVTDEPPRVFVVASIGGGTGGGMLVDLGFLITRLLKEFQFHSCSPCAILPYTSTAKPTERDLARANAYASLIELNHFSDPQNPYPGSAADGIGSMAADEVPFGDCYLVHLGENLDWELLVENSDRIAEYLYLNVAPESAAFFDDYRGNTSINDVPRNEVKLRSFGVGGFTYPRIQLARMGAVGLAESIVADWRGSRLRVDQENLEMELLRLLSSERLEPKVILGVLESFCEEILGSSIHQAIQRWIEESPLAAPEGVPGNPAEHLRALTQRIEAVVDRHARPSAKGLFPELANKAFAHANASIQKMTDWLNSLLESPRMTIISAEWATRWLIQYFVSAAEEVQTRVSRVQVDRRELQFDFEEKLRASGQSLWLLRKRSPLTPENRRELTVVCDSIFRETLLQLLSEVIRQVYREFSKVIEQFVLIRQRLNEFGRGFDEIQKEMAWANTLGLPILLPHNTDAEQAARSTVSNLTPTQREAVDRAFREKSLRPRGGILAMQTMTSTDLTALRYELVAECQNALLKVMESESAADLFFSMVDADLQPQRLLEQLRQAAPRLNPVGSWQHLVIAMPEGDAAKRLISMAKHASPNIATTLVRTEGDVLFCFEAANLSLRHVADALIDQNPDYVQVAQKFVTRRDVTFDTWALERT